MNSVGHYTQHSATWERSTAKTRTAPQVIETPTVAPVVDPVPFLERRRSQCSVIINDHLGEDVLCCGAPVDFDHFDFCRAHLVAFGMRRWKHPPIPTNDKSTIKRPYQPEEPEELK